MDGVLGRLLALDGLADLAAAWLKPFSLSTQKPEGTPLAEGTAQALDELLGHIGDRNSLFDQLDVLVGDEAFWTGIPIKAGTQDRTALAKLQSSKLDRLSLSKTLGEQGARRCAEGYDALKDFLARLSDHVSILKRQQTATLQPTVLPWDGTPKGLSAFLYDAGFPLFARKWLAAGMTSLISALAIARAGETEIKLQPWHALALAETFAGIWLQARDAVNCTTETFQAKVVGLVQQSPDLARIFDLWGREAVASRADVTFPLSNEE